MVKVAYKMLLERLLLIQLANDTIYKKFTMSVFVFAYFDNSTIMYGLTLGLVILF